MPKLRFCPLLHAGVMIGAFCATNAIAGTVSTLYTFTGGADGAFPAGGLVAGLGGSFYGTTLLGGSGCNGTGCGTIFRLSAPAAGSTTWTLTTLYLFAGGADGQEPINLIADTAGNLYGVAQYGGTDMTLCTVNGIALGCGTVFELSPPAAGKTQWQFSTLYTFTGGADGSFPNYGLTRDASGALYGYAYGGGTCVPSLACGTVFKLTPPAAGQTAWSESTIYAFAGGADGSTPYGIPVVSKTGDVYGTTGQGGFSKSTICAAAGGCGTVFKLAPPAAGKTNWTKTVLVALTAADGIFPEGSLYADTAGNLYGTANTGGNTTACAPTGATPGCGTVFEVSPPAAGATAWKFKVLYSFTGKADGVYPAAGLTPRLTSFYTTTSGNGLPGVGSVLQLSPPAAGATAWTETTLYDFKNTTDGAQPTDALLLKGGVLYGTSFGHDGQTAVHYGTIFSIVP